MKRVGIYFVYILIHTPAKAADQLLTGESDFTSFVEPEVQSFSYTYINVIKANDQYQIIYTFNTHAIKKTPKNRSPSVANYLKIEDFKDLLLIITCEVLICFVDLVAFHAPAVLISVFHS